MVVLTAALKAVAKVDYSVATRVVPTESLRAAYLDEKSVGWTAVLKDVKLVENLAARMDERWVAHSVGLKVDRKAA